MSLTVTSFALAFGVFSATSRTVTVTGTISYVATNVLVEIESYVVNGFQDDDLDNSMLDINATRQVTVRNFNESYEILSNFTVYSGNSGAFITNSRWNLGSMYFNPNIQNVVPSNQTPGVGQVSATIELVFVISNYSRFPVEVKITPLVVANSLDDILVDGEIGYDLTDANISSITESNADRSNVSSGTSKIYLKLNNLNMDKNSLNFAFTVEVAKIDN